MALRIIFIHLGNAQATHMWANISNILQSQREIEIDVITSYSFENPPLLNPRVNYYTYKASSKVTGILNSLTMDEKFRQGFWRFSLERLFALTAHHDLYPNDSLLHIESDILLLSNFPFDSFQSITTPAWLKFDKTRDLATILYLPDISKSQWFTEKMVQEVKNCNEINDMQLLNLISSKYPSEITILPSSPNTTTSLLNDNDFLEEKEKQLLSTNFYKFEGIFDPAALGIWLTGSDPRNNFGVTRRFDIKRLLEGKTYIDPSKVFFEYSQDNCLYITDNSRKITVFNLHIHSKNLRLFNQGWEEEISRLVRVSKSGRVQRTYSLRIFLGLVTSNYRNGTLVKFISWFPFLAPVRKFRSTIKGLLR